MSLAGLKYYLKHPRRIYAFFASRGMLNWMPDKAYLKMAFRANTGKKLNLKDPKTFNEKLQWLKLYNRKPEYTTMVDKYEAKKYVAEKLGEEYIIPTLGVWDRFDDIDFDALPDQFVLKCTHDSGGLVICRDKSKLDKEKAKEKIETSLKNNYYWNGREWPYKNVKPRILAEQYMEDESGNGLRDYKFFTFNGESKFLYLSEGLEDHATASISFCGLDGREMPFHRADYKPFSELPAMPENFSDMVELSDRLAKLVDSPFVRCDFYSVDGHIYFSEITFTPCGGALPFEPGEWDETLGNWIKLPIRGGGTP